MDASSGFKWILARLGDDVRTKYCSQALHEELADVQAHLSTCCEAMAHAEEVGTAIASLEAAQGASIRPQSVVALLSELHALQRSCQRQMAALRQPFTDAPSKASTSERTAKKEKPKLASSAPAPTAVEEEDKYADQRKLLSKMQTILSKRRRSTWLSDAVDVMREFAKSSPVEDAAEHEEVSKQAKKVRKDWKKFTIRALKALRMALLEEASEQEEQPPRFLKALKKLTKRNSDLTSFYEESEELLTAKEQEIAVKKAKKKSEKNAKKKRRLSDASTTSSVAPSAPEVVKKASHAATGKPEKKLAIAEIRVLLTRCTKDIKLLRDRFTNELFDQNLNHLEDIASSLSSEFTYDDVSSLLTSFFAVVEHVEKVKQPVKRKNRLMRLEATMQVLVDTTSIPISGHCRAMVQEYLTSCQKSLKQIQTHPGGADESRSVKETRTSENKAKKTHAVASQQTKRVKHESGAAASSKVTNQHHQPASVQPPAKKKKKKEMLTMGGHVRF